MVDRWRALGIINRGGTWNQCGEAINADIPPTFQWNTSSLRPTISRHRFQIDMRAARYYAAGDIRIEDVPTPELSTGDNKVLVEVDWCGICGSDLMEYLVGPFTIPSARTGPHPLTNTILPVTMGHEFTGRITHLPDSVGKERCIGAQGTPLKAGQAVVIDPRYYCSSCLPCSQSATNCCEKFGFVGLSGGGGGLSEFVAVSASQVYVLPESEASSEAGGVDLAAAALIEPLAVGWHAVQLFLSTHPSPPNLSTVPVLVIGADPVGVATIFVLRAFGVKTILVSEPSRVKREMVQQTGITTEIHDPTEVNIPDRCKKVTGDGVGVVFDCAGSQPGFEAGCESLRFRGVYVNISVPKNPMTLPLGPFIKKEITFKCSLSYNDKDFGDTVDAFVAGQFSGVEKMITKRLALEDIVEDGFEELIKPNDHIKMLATPKDANLSRET
ncbi:chaperonin 10-like protein [Aspergillus crustosus]